MKTKIYKYRALQVQQTTSKNLLTLFSAPAAEILDWGGIPQKRRFGTGESDPETTGFQREENAGRVESLAEFYSNPDNIIQNPLLAATRALDSSSVTFSPDPEAPESHAVSGELAIEVPVLAALTFEELLEGVRSYLESRLPTLQTETVDASLVARLKKDASEAGIMDSSSTSDVLENDEPAEDPDLEHENDQGSGLFEDSHMLEFWNEVSARHELAKQIDSQEMQMGDSFLGFSRDALISYLTPVVIVDGQHRLQGAIAAAKGRINSEAFKETIETLIDEGAEPTEIEAALIRKEARPLPISLLMSSDPAEQVFQFVVVNQKATPVNSALLGTIVATTLTNDERNNVADRLKNAGIRLEEAQAITYLAKHPSSPFCGLVDRGLGGDRQGLLQWAVFASLVSIFRDLKGGKLFGQKNDFATLWAKRYLEKSPIVPSGKSDADTSVHSEWSAIDGPWRDVFIAFWTKVRDTFADTEDTGAENYWGKPRSSNLFNKISLTILAADFFNYLVTSKTAIESKDSIDSLVDDWLEEVDVKYFSRDWKLPKGIKKDAPAIRNAWAETWSSYRVAGGPLPDRRNFSPKVV